MPVSPALPKTRQEIAEAPNGGDSDPPILLLAEGLGVTYPRHGDAAIANVSLAIRQGEVVLLLGASGCGKTTLLRALEGSIRPSAGAIQRHGKVVLIYQDLRLVPERTVLENVCDGAGSRRWWRTSPDVRERATELLADLGLSQYATQRVGTLSGGQKQRVAIARALCARPAVLLADEPLAALDRSNARRVLALLARLQKKYNFALVLSVHNVAVESGAFTRQLLMQRGSLKELAGAELEAHQRELTRPLTVCAEGEPCAEDYQDALLSRPGADRWERTGRIVAVIAALAVVVWAERSLKLLEELKSGALGRAIGFFQRAIPENATVIRELPWERLLASLLETIQMAIVGTALGVALSLPLAALASRQTGPVGFRHALRFLLNVIRTIPSIIWALVFVASVGLGPFSGVLALAMYSTGYLTKFFYEAIENTDERPALALQALGAGRARAFLAAILPGARAALVGAALFVFEYNIRSASILGVVGAGGIGQDLMYYIEWRNFPAAFAGLGLILAVVVVLDAMSGVLRRRIATQRGT
jgi:phosphonate transport system permease protein